MNQNGAPEEKPPSRPGLPVGYRQGVITAITVMLAFSLYFLRFWNFEAPGACNSLSVIAAGLIVASIVIQLGALWRSLQVADESEPVYRRTLQWFLAGIVLVLLGAGVAAVAAPHLASSRVCGHSVEFAIDVD